MYQTKETVGDNITAYSYDLAGNRLQMRKCENAQVTNEVDYTLGIGNRLASWGTNGVARYNTAGCLTNMVSNSDGRELNLSWDERYQLSTVNVDGELSISYDYNVLGQRVARSEVAAGVDLSADRQANTEYYVHEGVNIVADLDSDRNLLRSYSYAPGYDNIVSMTTYGDSETNTYFYIQNNNNSVVALVDEAGDVAESYTYTAYGVVTVFDANGNEMDQSALGNRYTFQGRELDYTTGLYNFRARWYSSETGRWLSKDPIGINGGLNQYVFCGNNPVMFIDPEGLEVYVFKEGLNRHLGLIIVDASGVAIERSFIADPNDSMFKVVTGMKGIVTDMRVNLEDERFENKINLHFTDEQECLLKIAVERIKLKHYAFFTSNCTSSVVKWLMASGYLSVSEGTLIGFDWVDTPLEMYNYLKLRELINK